MTFRRQIAVQIVWLSLSLAVALATNLPQARAGAPTVEPSDVASAAQVACGGPTPPYAPELVEELAATALREGDAKNGANVFRSARFACRSCHRIGDSGAELGPDLSNVGRLRTAAQIVESLLWPSRQVEPAFASTMVLTVDGVAYCGCSTSPRNGKSNCRKLTSRPASLPGASCRRTLPAA